MSARARYTERRAPCRTDSQYIVQLSGYTWALRQLGDPAGRILDAACGTGFGTTLLAGAGWRAVGVDLAPDAILEARARHLTPGLAYVVMDVTRLGFGDGTFDAVISQDTIEHVADDDRFVAEMARVLHPGGALILFTPYRDVHCPRPDNPYHRREYSPESLRHLLETRFPGVRLFGRRPAATLATAEAVLDEVRRYDAAGLRQLLPRSLRHWIGSLWLRWRGAKSLGEISVDDVEYIPEAPAGSTTLVAVCRGGA